MKEKKPRKMGARSIISTEPERIKVFLEGIQLGQTIKDSAEYANINPSTIHMWAAKGEEEKEAGKRTKYVDFLEQFNKAKQQFIRNGLYQIYQASRNDWRAAAYLLKMRHPQDYGDNQNHNIKGDDIQIKIVNDVKDE